MPTKVFCVIGWPVHHSASPAMMNAVFTHVGLDAQYVALEVMPDRLGEAVSGLRALGFCGANVTVPHKSALMPLLDEISPAAVQAGAVNVVRIDAQTGRMEGHNSDIDGWYRSLADRLTPDVCRRVCVLGAGGGARGVAMGLAMHASHVHLDIVARRPEQLAQFVSSFGQRLDVEPVLWEDRAERVEAADVVINATSIGMWPHVAESPIADAGCFHPGQVVQDIIYRPLTTRFLDQASGRGAEVRDGLWMLVYQGAINLHYWLGLDAPVDIMRAAAQRHVLQEGSRIALTTVSAGVSRVVGDS